MPSLPLAPGTLGWTGEGVTGWVAAGAWLRTRTCPEASRRTQARVLTITRRHGVWGELQRPLSPLDAHAMMQRTVPLWCKPRKTQRAGCGAWVGLPRRGLQATQCWSTRGRRGTTQAAGLPVTLGAEPCVGRRLQPYPRNQISGLRKACSFHGGREAAAGTVSTQLSTNKMQKRPIFRTKWNKRSSLV